MKTKEKESASTNAPRAGGGGRGRGFRGRGGGRGGGRFAGPRGGGRGGRGRGDHRRPASTGEGGRGGNHGRHPKSPNHSQRKSRKNQGARGRPRSSSYNEKDEYTPKKSGPYAHLFCSERHAFALSRVLYPRNNDNFLLPLNMQQGDSNNHRIATNDQLEQWWESVKIVRCHVKFNESTDANSSNKSSRLSFQERCPICLDEEMVSPFIAPCGHAFCLPCVLGYLSSVTKDLNEESDRIHKTKPNVKGGYGVVGTPCLKNRATITSVRARCPMCSSGSSMELHAGEPVLAYKDLRPVVFVPTLAICAAPVGGEKGERGKKGDDRKHNPPRRGTRMKFVKLHRVKSCPVPYLPLQGHCVRGALASATSLPDLPDGDNNPEECIYARSYFVGLDEYENILQRNLDDLNNYRERTVYCEMDPREDWNVSMAIEAIKAAQRRWLGSCGGDGGFRRMESDAISACVTCRGEQMPLGETGARKNSIEGEAKNRAKSQNNSGLLQPGSFYLRQNMDSNKADEFLYYQSSDGQPCFLSGIDIRCLMHEFSVHEQKIDIDTDETQGENEERGKAYLPLQQHKEAPNQPRNARPLPDEITGTVLEIEQLTVTNSLIKRRGWLSHIPIASSVSLVEIDWYTSEGNGPMLSHSTLSKFRGELQRRNLERIRAAKQEQKNDKAARAKSEKAEQRRRRELLGANYVDAGTQQTIDPDDDFFQSSAASFEESEVGDSQRSRSSSFQLSEVCAAGGTFPELSFSSQSNRDRAARASVASVPPAAALTPSSPPQANNIWGRGHKHTTVNNFPSLSESALSMHKPHGKGRTKTNNGPWGS